MPCRTAESQKLSLVAFHVCENENAHDKVVNNSFLMIVLALTSTFHSGKVAVCAYT